MITEKVDVKRVNEVSAEASLTAFNLCNQEVVIGEDMTINYTYTELGRQNDDS